MKRVGFLIMLLPGAMNAQELTFEEYDPPSTLVAPEHVITRSKYPFIDVHSHQFGMASQNLAGTVAEMERMNMMVMVNLSGRGRGSQDHLQRSIENARENYPKRFVVFTNVDFDNVDQPGWKERTLKALEGDVRLGAAGLKVYKSLGMYNRDGEGNRILIDDPRLDPVWAKCGELGIPVLIHSADPKPFWEEMDAQNERWLELKTRSGRKRGDNDPAPWQTIIDEQHNLFRKHPGTKFINAHFGWYANDLKKLGELLDEMPNVYVEFGAIIAELGRQPRYAREFFIKYQDRIMFGKDSWVPDEYVTYFRVLETADDYFPYHKRYHAFWRMYGMDLPDEVLKKVYYKNALKVIPGIDASLFPK